MLGIFVLCHQCLLSHLVMLSLAIYVFSNPIPFEGEVSYESLMLLRKLEHKMSEGIPWCCFVLEEVKKINDCN